MNDYPPYRSPQGSSSNHRSSQYFSPPPNRNRGNYRRRATLLRAMTLITLGLVVSLVVVILIKNNQPVEYIPVETGVPSDTISSVDPSVTSTEQPATTDTLPLPTEAPDFQEYMNPLLYPPQALMNASIGAPGTGLSTDSRGVDEKVMDASGVLSAYSRQTPILFGDPVYYQDVPGVLTFRGNQFRNAPTYGQINGPATTLTQVWDYARIGTRYSSAGTYTWSGTGWTGQPVIIQWEDDVREMMNLYADKKAKTGLKEVIIAAMDGKIYFFDLDDGKPTRDPINQEATVKGTVAVDPRGYPMLFVGQGDSNHPSGEFGFRIYNLIDGSRMYYQNGLDERAHRQGWGACDSSPIMSKEADTLVFPNENGIIYTLKLNTEFDRAAKTLKIDPVASDYAYRMPETTEDSIGIESSMAIYKNYGYACDNGGNLFCIDLNTMQMQWIRLLEDDSDLSPAISEENGKPYLYIGTEVDHQKSELDYLGEAYTYKIDAMTGAIVWKTSHPAWTHNGERRTDDINGGLLASPIIGKGKISDLVLFAYCMTNGVYSGNQIVAYDKATGTKRWVYNMNMYSWSSPIDIYDKDGNPYIVIFDSIGQVHLVDGITGTRLTYIHVVSNPGTANEYKDNQIFESSPAAFDNMIVAGSRWGGVFGIKIE